VVSATSPLLKNVPYTHWAGGWMNPRAGWDGGKFSVPMPATGNASDFNFVAFIYVCN
jgi:hypothetical protein